MAHGVRGGLRTGYLALVASVALRSDLAARARDRFLAAFQRPDVLGQYENALTADGA